MYHKEKLYYSEPNLLEFSARVVEIGLHGAQTYLVLEQTAFYATSGGQPHDTGTLFHAGTQQTWQVLDVQMRASDSVSLHYVDGVWGLAVGAMVQGSVDATRRRDHQQQHSGQHILSQAFLQVADRPTVGFHLGKEIVTIDLAGDELAGDALAQAEELANQVVGDNLPVRAWFPSEQELSGLQVRKIPEIAGNALRLVAMGDFDLNACAGTHVNSTAEIGLIKIIRAEKLKQKQRITFLCGGRALADYSRRLALTQQLAASFSCGVSQLSQAVASLQSDYQALQRQYKTARIQWVQLEVQAIAAQVQPVNGWQVYLAVVADKTMAELNSMARTLLENQTQALVLLANAGESGGLVWARTASKATPDLRPILSTVLTELPHARGGGQAHQVQASGFSAVPAQMQTLLTRAKVLALGD
ncbi:MAG TPA: alanyl-tRNA editing protein [Anaerolineales bacterium]|nr:alanyl-tRNA editing protein [Anaerolineales bacterium]